LILIFSSFRSARIKEIEMCVWPPAFWSTSIIILILNYGVPFSVLAETVFKTITAEKESKDPQKLEQISALIELWRKLEIRFLLPSDEAAEICWNLVEECQGRMQPTDRTHLGYSLAYGMDFLITTDKILRHYQVPDGFPLKIVSLREARETIGL
jgi:hypothetical protein